MILNYEIYLFEISIFKNRVCIYTFFFLVLQIMIVRKTWRKGLKEKKPLYKCLCSTHCDVTMFNILECYYVRKIAMLLCFPHCTVTMVLTLKCYYVNQTFQHYNVHHVVISNYVRHILMSSYVCYMTRFVCLWQIMKINFWTSFFFKW